MILLLLINISIINSQNQTENQNVEEEKKTEGMILMEEFSNEWEAKMQDYNMEYLYYIPLQYRDQEIYYENITSVPTTFKGSFSLG